MSVKIRGTAAWTVVLVVLATACATTSGTSGDAKPPPAKCAGAPKANPAKPSEHARILAAALKHFPEAYDDLSTFQYQHTDGSFLPDAVVLLVPAAKAERIAPAELKRRACAMKESLGWSCACERVLVGPPENYAWHEWPDKRVVKLTIRFLIAC